MIFLFKIILKKTNFIWIKYENEIESENKDRFIKRKLDLMNIRKILINKKTTIGLLLKRF